MSLAFAVAVIPAGFLVDRTPRGSLSVWPLRFGRCRCCWRPPRARRQPEHHPRWWPTAAGDGLAMALLRPSWQHFQACLVPAAAARDAAVLDSWIARAGPSPALAGVGGGRRPRGGRPSSPARRASCRCSRHWGLGLEPLCANRIRLRGQPGRCAGRGRHCGFPEAGQRDPRRCGAGAGTAGRRAGAGDHGGTTAVHYLWLIAFAAGVGALAGTTWVTVAWHRDCPAQHCRRAAGVLAAVLAIEAVALGSGAISRRAGGWRRPAWWWPSPKPRRRRCSPLTGSLVQADAPEGYGAGHRPGPAHKAHRDVSVGLGGGRDDGPGPPRCRWASSRWPWWRRWPGCGVQWCGERGRLRPAWDAWPARSRPVGWSSARASGPAERPQRTPAHRRRQPRADR